jgi:basic amino acid/polyamine antiporter, APA family
VSGREVSGEGLHVAIGLPGAVMLVVGGIIGVGVFANPALVARDVTTPAMALAAWGAGGVIALLGAFVYAELAARMPMTGGEYVYLRDTYGPLAGFLYGWTTLLVVHTGGLAAVTIIFARNFTVVTGLPWPEPVVGLTTLALLATLNAAGVGLGNAAQSGLGLLRLLAIAALVMAGLAMVPHGAEPPRPPPPGGALKGFAAAIAPVVFSYGGWQTSNFVAGEIRDPARNLSRALLVGVVVVITVYLLVNFAYLRALGLSALGASLTPTSDVLARAVGPTAGRVAAGAIALSALTFMSQSILTGPRVCFAMARDGLFFRAVARISETSRAPVAAIFVLTAWAGVLALSGQYEAILSYDVSMNYVFFALTATCLFVYRRGGGDPHPPGFRAPAHPITTGLFVLASVAVVVASVWAYPLDCAIGFAILAAGVPVYGLFRRRQGRA